MSDDLFNYFGKGSKKFEPLDDDLDLPDVSQPKSESSKSPANPNENDIDAMLRGEVDEEDLTFGSFGDSTAETVAQVDDSIEAVENKHGEPQFDFSEPPHHDVIEPGTVEVEVAKPTAEANDFGDSAEAGLDEKSDASDPFGFGAGLFDEDIVELDAPARLPAPTQEKTAAVETSPVADASVGKEVTETVGAAEPPKQKRSALGMIASVLGIGGKEDKPAKSESGKSAVQKSTSSDDDLFAADEDEGLLSFETIDPPEKNTPLPSMFKSEAKANDFEDGEDPDELIGWSSPERKMVDDVTPDEDEFDEDEEQDEDEDFIEFEIEELTPNAPPKPEVERGSRRRRRQPNHRDSEPDGEAEVEVESRDSADSDESNSRPSRRRRGGGNRDRDDQVSPKTQGSRSNGRGRRGRSDSSGEDVEVEAKSNVRSNADENEEKPSRKRSRGRGRGRNDQDRETVAKGRSGGGRGRNRDDRFVDDEAFEDDDVVEEFVEDSADNDEVEESKPRRRRRRGRGRGRGRNENESSEQSRDTPANDTGDEFEPDDFGQDEDGDDIDESRVVSDKGRSSRESSSSRGRGRGRRRNKPAEDDRDDDSFESPKHVSVPTWDETIEGMIESNIKKHSGNSPQRRGGGRGGNKSGGGGNSNNSNSNGGRRRR